MRPLDLRVWEGNGAVMLEPEARRPALPIAELLDPRGWVLGNRSGEVHPADTGSGVFVSRSTLHCSARAGRWRKAD